MEITNTLLSAQSPDGQTRSTAESTLKHLQNQNLPQFLLSLSLELSNDQKPPHSRRLAGIILKNTLHSSQHWVNVDLSTKSQIKDSLLNTLGSSVAEARHSSSQAISKLAGIEIPVKAWPDLISRLLSNLTNSAPHLKKATLETLGYICEEVMPQDLEQNQVDSILTGVVQCMSQLETNSDVRLAAVRALYNALDFAQTNFEKANERDFIMRIVCETVHDKEVEIRKSGFECLVSIGSIYYDYLNPYMETLGLITCNAIRVDSEIIALQAIEFWNTICEEEIKRQEGSIDDNSHSNYIKSSLNIIIPILLETLTKQEDNQDQDDTIYNISMGAGTCLGLVSKTVSDEVVPLVMPFIEDNIINTNWRNREAAIFAFGSILQGPEIEKIKPIVVNALDFLLNLMKDKNGHVRDSTAWTLGRIFEILHDPASGNPVIHSKNMPKIIVILLESIRDVPNVAERVCTAIYYLAKGYESSGAFLQDFAIYYQNIVSALLLTADRADVSTFKLRDAAYETLNEVIRCSYVPKTLILTAELLKEIMNRLVRTFELKILYNEDLETQGELQALLCGSLQVIIQKLGHEPEGKMVISQAADQLMVLFFKVFECRSTSVHGEAMLAVGALINVTAGGFIKYMPDFYKYLELGLQNFKEYQVCIISIGVIGDICRALEDKILPYYDLIMSILLKNLSDPGLYRPVKPCVFTCFGDIALATRGHFGKYLQFVGPMLESASEMCIGLNADDLVEIEFVNKLRKGVLEAYSGIFQGFKTDDNGYIQIMRNFAEPVMSFVESVFRDLDRDDMAIKAAVGVMGDMADALGKSTRILFFDDFNSYEEWIEEALQSEDDSVKDTAMWAQSVIRNVLFC